MKRTPRKPREDLKKKPLVESSSLVDLRPRQPQLRQGPPRGSAPVRTKKQPGRKKMLRKDTLTAAGMTKQNLAASAQRLEASKEIIEAAQATGLLPHEWMLAVMRGEQLNHFAYDAESGEIVEVIVLPTFSDRMECARACAPYYAIRPQAPKQGDAGGPVDPTKQPGVMEVPLAQSMEHWIGIAGPSQAKLKREVTK